MCVSCNSLILVNSQETNVVILQFFKIFITIKILKIFAFFSVTLCLLSDT